MHKKIELQEKELLSKCDGNLADNLSELDKTSKFIVKRIDELKTSSVTMSEATRKDEVIEALLRFCS